MTDAAGLSDRTRSVQRVEYKVRLTPSLAAHLREHAHERDVPRSVLLSDIFQAWCAVMTDPENPRYRPEWLGVRTVEMPPERRPGYLATLGFMVDPVDGELSHEAPQIVHLTRTPETMMPGASWETKPPGSHPDDEMTLEEMHAMERESRW